MDYHIHTVHYQVVQVENSKVHLIGRKQYEISFVDSISNIKLYLD